MSRGKVFELFIYVTNSVVNGSWEEPRRWFVFYIQFFLFISINVLGLEELCLYLFNEVKGQGTVHGQILI